MSEIKFDTGLKSFTVNGNTTVEFNPADAAFAHRLYTVIDTLQNMENNMPDPNPENYEDIWKAVGTRENAITKEIDGLFGAGKSTEIFGNVSPLALSGGVPLWLNFLLAVMDEMSDEIKEQEKQVDIRLQNLKTKYGPYMAKYGKKV